MDKNKRNFGVFYNLTVFVLSVSVLYVVTILWLSVYVNVRKESNLLLQKKKKKKSGQTGWAGVRTQLHPLKLAHDL